MTSNSRNRGFVLLLFAVVGHRKRPSAIYITHVLCFHFTTFPHLPGFWFELLVRGSEAAHFAHIDPKHEPLGEFADNVVHSCFDVSVAVLHFVVDCAEYWTYHFLTLLTLSERATNIPIWLLAPRRSHLHQL